jgi:Mg2+/Co2+ transporter CorB
METLTYLLILTTCLTLSAFFSSSETALLRLRQQDVKKDIDADQGPAALAARDLIRSPSRLLVTILLGNNLVNVAAASVAAELGVRFLGVRQGLLVSTAAMLTRLLPRRIVTSRRDGDRIRSRAASAAGP